MPLYEYRCQKCGRLFEQMRRMSEADQPGKCPHCQSAEVQRQVAVMARVTSTSTAADCGPSGNT